MSSSVTGRPYPYARPGHAPQTTSELEPRDQLPLTRCAECCPDIDISKSSSGLARAVPARCRQRVDRRRIGNLCAVENVGELGPDLKARSLLNTENSSETQVLHRTP